MNPSSEREAPSDQAFEIVSAWLREQKEVANGTMLYRMCKFADFVIARASLSNQPQQAGWMPIETAPKTGRTLLLGYFNSAGNWRTMRGQWMSQDYIDEYWEEPDDAEPGWFETVVEGDDIPNCWRTEPTHWMLLPLPPVPGQEGVANADQT